MRSRGLNGLTSPKNENTRIYRPALRVPAVQLFTPQVVYFITNFHHAQTDKIF